MSSEVAIQVDGVSKSYRLAAAARGKPKRPVLARKNLVNGRLWALKDVSFRVHRGETLGIIGRNGAGKTTLLRVISEITTPSSGSITVYGSMVAVLALQSGFNQEFTGRENVYLKCAIMGLSRKQADERMEEILDFANIDQFIDRPLKTYSQGMRARLAFAVAFNVEPEILVIDEVLAVGDEAFRRKCLARIASLKDKGATILMVTHGPAQLQQFCDRAVLLDHGEVVLVGPPKQIVSRYQRLLYTPSDGGDKAKTTEARKHDAEQGSGTAATAFEKPPGAPRPDYDPTLVPESISRSVPQGAQIVDGAILDRRDRRVNLLAPRSDYKLGLRVSFQQPAARVRFFMIIKTLDGLEISGAWSHSRGGGLEYVEQGSRYFVTFPFNSALAPGMYFVDLAVFARIEGKEMALHKIGDAIAFRVNPDEERPVVGLTDLSVAPFCELQEHPEPRHEVGPRKVID